MKSPVDGSLVGQVREVTTGEIDKVIGRLARYQPTWAARSTDERAKILHRVVDRLEAGAAELVEVLVMEVAKVRKDSRVIGTV